MMEKEESKCRGRVNVEFRKDRWDVVDGDERRQKLVTTQRQRLGEIVGHVDAAGNVPHAPENVLAPHGSEANATACRRLWRTWA